MMIVGMSGGVDSSVSALLLKRRGENLRGVFMKNWEDDGSGECRAEEDRKDALRVCSKLEIPFVFRNFANVYKEQVFSSFLEGYRRGWTPNPDILCNREVKFKAFLSDALNQGADRLATGHYARKMVNEDGSAMLYRGVDRTKDQSYFLIAITQEALQKTEFPVGHLPKVKVRGLAEEAGLVTARKKDSTGICFIGEQDFKTFLGKYIPARPGNIVDLNGNIIGQHTGSWFYTVGQRAPVGGVKGASSEPWFVAKKNVEKNELIVVQGSNHPALYVNSVVVEDLNWISGSPLADRFNCELQWRHLGSTVDVFVDLDKNDNKAIINFSRPVRSVAVGQAAGLYLGDHCLGGGVITETFN